MMNLLTLPQDPLSLIEQSKAGITMAELTTLQKEMQLSTEQLAAIVHLTPRSLQGYQPTDRLKPRIAERALALAQLYARGFDLMGPERFRRWMSREHLALGKRSPVQLLDTYFGIQLLLDELGRIEHGVLA